MNWFWARCDACGFVGRAVSGSQHVDERQGSRCPFKLVRMELDEAMKAAYVIGGIAAVLPMLRKS